MRPYVILFALAALSLAACETSIHCGAFVYSPEEGRCTCPPGFIENEDFTNCVPIDGGLGPDGGTGDAGACVPTTETCNGIDDDCDGVVDGPAAAASCTARDRTTTLACLDGACEVATCETGYLDCDADVETGCEQASGTLEACTSCDETCGWECTSAGCDDAIDIDAGRDHICLVRQSGSVWCWGNNDRGQLGLGTMGAAIDAPAQVVGPTGTGTLTDVVDVSAGDGFTCAVRRDGTVWCWGVNANGQLGTNSLVASTFPAAVLDVSGATSVTAGGSHACALTTAAEVWCWGRNQSGQLGIDRGDSARALRVTALANVRAVGAGNSFTCVLREDSQVRCFGLNLDGALGDGSGSSSSTVPVAPSGLGSVSDLGVGDRHACAITSAEGDLWCWGSNYNGDFGAPDFGNYDVPFRIETGGAARSVFAGWGGTCVIFTTGRSQCFENAPVPAPMSARQIALGLPGAPSCAVTTSGAVQCWTGTPGVPMPLPAP